MNFNPNILSSLPSGYYLPIFFAVSFYYSMNLNSSPRAGAQSNDLKRVEIKAEETTFPNLSHFWTLLQLNQINQRGRCKNAPHPLIFLFGSSVKVWNMRGLKVTFEGKDFVAACLWFLFFQNILQHWVHGWVRALWKESKEKYNCESREKYKQKSGTNTERGQLGGVDFSLVQCGNSPWHVFGRFAANLVTILPKLSIYLLNKDPVWINGN